MNTTAFHPKIVNGIALISPDEVRPKPNSDNWHEWEDTDDEIDPVDTIQLIEARITRIERILALHNMQEWDEA